MTAQASVPFVSRPAAYTVKEAAALLGVSRSTLYRLFDSGQLRSVWIGRRRLVPSSDLHRLAETGAVLGGDAE